MDCGVKAKAVIDPEREEHYPQGDPQEGHNAQDVAEHRGQNFFPIEGSSLDFDSANRRDDPVIFHRPRNLDFFNSELSVVGSFGSGNGILAGQSSLRLRLRGRRSKITNGTTDP
jgi:hypothetical protein